jgi:hypothetical protein
MIVTEILVLIVTDSASSFANLQICICTHTAWLFLQTGTRSVNAAYNYLNKHKQKQTKKMQTDNKQVLFIPKNCG